MRSMYVSCVDLSLLCELAWVNHASHVGFMVGADGDSPIALQKLWDAHMINGI